MDGNNITGRMIELSINLYRSIMGFTGVVYIGLGTYAFVNNLFSSNGLFQIVLSIIIIICGIIMIGIAIEKYE